METPNESAAPGESLDDLPLLNSDTVESHAPCFQATASYAVLYLSACRTTGCDVMCITSTSQRFTEGKVRRKGPRMQGLAATIQYPNETAKLLGARTKVKMKTPADELTDDAVRVRRNRELHGERNEFLKQLREKEEMTAQLESASATNIQRTWRGYLVRLTQRAQRTGALPRHQVLQGGNELSEKRPAKHAGIASLIVPRITITKATIGEELRALAVELDLKPIPGLSLPMPSHKKSKRQRQQEQQSALILQCAWRMYVAKQIRWQRQQERDEEKRHQAVAVIIRAWRRYRKRKSDPEHNSNKESARNQMKYRAFAQKFHSNAAARMAEHQKLAAEVGGKKHTPRLSLSLGLG